MISLHNVDALEHMKTMPSASVDVVVTDPPYSSGGQFRDDRNKNTTSKYQTTETEKEYPDFMGDSRDQLAYYYWCALWLGQCSRILKPGRLVCVFTDWRQLATTINAVQIGGFVWRGIIPWNKTEAARPSKGRFRAQCEYIVWASVGPISEQTDECLPGFFTYPVRPNDKKHVTAKPLSLMLDILKVAGKQTAVVFDPFMGSGTTGVACAQLGHSFIGCEIDTNYFNIAKKLIEKAEKQHILFTPPSNTACSRRGESARQKSLFNPEADTAKGSASSPAPRG